MLRAHNAFLFAILFIAACSAGCGNPTAQPAQAQERAANPPPVRQAVRVRAQPQAEPPAAPSVPAASTDWSLPGLAAAIDALRVPVVAVDDRTVVDQPLPVDVKNRWRDKIRTLADANPQSLKLIDQPAEADWLIQVAALERTDIIYLVPSKRTGNPQDDESLRMSPPGELAIDWLKDEIKLAVAARADVAALEPVVGAPAPVADAPPSGAPAAPSSSPVGGGFMPEQARRFLSFTREGPAEDLKAEIVQEQSGIYHTPNRTQALLGTYGKVVEGNKFLGRLARFEHRGVIQRPDNVRRFVTVQRQGRGSGKDFVSFIGNRQAWQVVDLAGQISLGRHNEVAFEIVGVRLDQNDVIRALNSDSEALNYFEYVQRNKEKPCFVLENLVFTSYAAAKGTSLGLGGKAKVAVTGDGAEARIDTERTAFTQFTSPVVRCYQMYEVKLQGDQVMELVYLEP